MDLYRSNWRRFWVVCGGFCGEFGCEMVCRPWSLGGVGSDLGVGGGLVAVPYEM
jgi:hypothetical protein